MLETVVEILAQRGVATWQVAEVTFELQKAYIPGLTVEEAEASVLAVLGKREVQNAVMTGVALDELAESNRLKEPLASMVKHDDPLFGVDEILALAITNVYGSIGLTNFGFVDKTKPGLLRALHDSRDHVNTFLDDIVAGIAAAAAARLAHRASRKE